jgi:hypothetical protein
LQIGIGKRIGGQVERLAIHCHVAGEKPVYGRREGTGIEVDRLVAVGDIFRRVAGLVSDIRGITNVTPNGSGTETVVASGSAVATPIAKDAAAATPPEARVTDVMMRSMTSLPLADRPSRQPPSPTEGTGSDELYLRI